MKNSSPLPLPRISVVICSFNQNEFLRAAIESVVSQEYPGLELIIMDGGSTDGSRETIEAFSAKISYWRSEPDGGQTYGLIAGFSQTTGEVQCWLNSDDLLAPGALHEVGSYFRMNPSVDVVFGDTKWMDRGGNKIRSQREIPFIKFVWLRTYNYVPGMSTFWRKRLFEAVGGLDPKFDLAMDADLWARFSERGKLQHVPAFWSYMRFYGEQKTQRYAAASSEEMQRIVSRYIDVSRPIYRVERAIAYTCRGILKMVALVKGLCLELLQARASS